MASKNFVLTMAVVTALGAATLDAQQSTTAKAQESRRFYADDPLWIDNDMRDIAPVAKDELSKSYDFVHNTFAKRARLRSAAVNVNTLGEVPDSSWFTNRIGTRDMAIDEVLRGPDTIDGPAPGPWEVIGHPTAGITPKFAIRDANGVVFMIKLDPVGIPELASSVELISTKIFHAIGYTVPEDFIAALDPRQLRVGENVRIKSETGRERKLTLADVHLWLKHQDRQADGTIRVLASRWVPGKVVGSFRFTGTRPDDPNDIHPHDERRELRGLRVFAAWLNHDDARSLNSIDSYVEEDGRRYIRHYLQDFGSTLGSGSTSRAAAARRLRIPDRKGQDRQGSRDLRPVAARLDEGEVFGSACPRQHREPRVRAGALEDGVSAPRIRCHGCRGRILGGADCRALHR